MWAILGGLIGGTAIRGLASNGIRLLIQSGVVSAVFTFLAPFLAKLGLGVVSYAALQPFLETVTNDALSYIQLPAEYIAFAGTLRVDQIITVWISALTVKLALMSLTKISLGRK